MNDPWSCFATVYITGVVATFPLFLDEQLKKHYIAGWSCSLSRFVLRAMVSAIFWWISSISALLHFHQLYRAGSRRRNDSL